MSEHSDLLSWAKDRQPEVARLDDEDAVEVEVAMRRRR